MLETRNEYVISAPAATLASTYFLTWILSAKGGKVAALGLLRSPAYSDGRMRLTPAAIAASTRTV